MMSLIVATFSAAVMVGYTQDFLYASIFGTTSDRWWQFKAAVLNCRQAGHTIVELGL